MKCYQPRDRKAALLGLLSAVLFLSMLAAFDYYSKPKGSPAEDRPPEVTEIDLSEQECLILLSPEESEEPRYRLGAGEECL